MQDIVISEDMSLNQVIKKYPSTMGVFNRYNVDSCCGGSRTLKAMAEEDKIDLGEFIRSLEEAAKAG